MRTINVIKQDINIVRADIRELQKMGASTWCAEMDLMELKRELRQAKVTSIKSFTPKTDSADATHVSIVGLDGFDETNTPRRGCGEPTQNTNRRNKKMEQNDLISRAKLYDFLTDALERGTGAYVKGRTTGINIARSALHNKEITPTVDAAPVVHGRWIHLYGDEWRCSVCDNVISTEGSWDKPTYKHCHECGAKMDGGTNS